ncbi:TRAP transporter small permease [Martelella radicis]|uniref:TRAP transporter small permease protein n=1 Tax=Martelella radicis TaxID=1397476 RepID=A0A7W6KHL5_9HYPH|nr:TRAP transporter small permease [Martelella radicis]MBB4121426.1 TRAP-type C4-dicarboxylate transport system permease small subunit [Martelella radicis]
MIRKITAAFGRLELVICNVSLVALVAILALQVFFRYALHMGLTWSEEVSRFVFIWFVYISASLAAQRGTHIRITLFIRWFPGGPRYALLIADLIWIVFNAFVIAAGVMLISRMLKYPSYSTALFLPMAWIYAVIPVSHALMILRIIERQWKAFRAGTSVIAGEQELAIETKSRSSEP